MPTSSSVTRCRKLLAHSYLRLNNIPHQRLFKKFLLGIRKEIHSLEGAMGAEWWDYRATFEADTPDLKAVLRKHKLHILPLTPDWEDIKISDTPGLFTLTPYPTTKEDVRAFYHAVGLDYNDYMDE